MLSISLLPEISSTGNPGKEYEIPFTLGIDDPSIFGVRAVEVFTLSHLTPNLWTLPLEPTPIPTIAIVGHLELTLTDGYTILSESKGWGIGKGGK
jgi:hypothetical protein